MNKSPKFPLWTRQYQHVFCKKPSIFVFNHVSQLVSFRKCVFSLCLPEPGSTFARGSIGVHETNWKCPQSSASGLPEALLKYFHQPNSARIPVANQAIHAIYISLHFFAFLIFIFVNGFCGFMQRVSPKLLTRTSTSFWYWIFGVSVGIKYGML